MRCLGMVSPWTSRARWTDERALLGKRKGLSCSYLDCWVLALLVHTRVDPHQCGVEGELGRGFTANLKSEMGWSGCFTPFYSFLAVGVSANMRILLESIWGWEVFWCRHHGSFAGQEKYPPHQDEYRAPC
jgi:hypothetical protein